MSEGKKEIKFNNSMTSDKRNENFAYLRKNVLPTETAGLYPSKDFIDIGVDIPAGYDVVDILGSDKYPFQIKAILSDGNNVIFRNLYGGGTDNDPLPSGVRYSASAFGSDGVYVLGSDKNVYRVNHNNGNTALVGAIASNPVTGGVGGWDGKFYWWANSNGIYQQLPNTGGTQIMTTIGQTILKMAFLNDQMVLAYKSGADIGVLFWDKNSTALFDKRIIVKNSTYLAMGAVDGSLILIRSVGNSANTKEYEGEIVVAGYDGENFKTLNSIRAGRRDVMTANSESGQNCDAGSEVMLFSVDNNSRAGVNQDLGQNYIYKVKNDGSIEVQYLPEARGTFDFARVVRIFYDFTLYAVESDTEVVKIYSNRDTSYFFSNYSNYSNTEYITPFLCNAFNDHKLEGFSVTFEKLFKNTDNAGTPPDVSNSTITVTNLDFTTLTLNWARANDGTTTQADLEYAVYQSATGDIDTITDITTNGTQIKNWTKDINTFNVTGLADDTDHYFNVLVRDSGGNMTKYSMIMVHTPLTTFVTAWTSPTKNGEVSFVGSLMPKMSNPENIYTEDGSLAVASQGTQKFSSFYGFGSFVPVGATIRGIEVRVKAKIDSSGTTAVLSHKNINASSGKTEYGTQTSGGGDVTLTTTLTTYTLGSSTFMWGTTWTPAELNSDDYGFIISSNTKSSPTPTVYSYDVLQVRVFYTI